MSAPATPGAATVTAAHEDSPGNWQHPKFDEIQARLRARTFGDSNVRTVATNLLVFFAAVLLPSLFSSFFPSMDSLWRSLSPYPQYLLLATRVVPLVFIAVACYPLLRKQDDLSDIALTPSQRALLGLGPASRPATPGSHYSTPPRYSRSATPRSSISLDSPASAASGTGAAHSPLFQKTVSRDVSRRLSYGSPASLGTSFRNESTYSVPGSGAPSPTAAHRSSFGLSSRWIYEKSKDSPSPIRRNIYA